MELKFVLTILLSFVFCFLLAPFFISFLFKFKIRRISKTDLEDKLPGRAVKFGTPVMGGALITLTVLFFAFVFLNKWEMFVPFALILIFGSIVGAVDEFINTIGRKGFSFAVRESVDEVVSKNRFFWKIYTLALVPWELFKEVFRIMGSSQRGLKTHQKFLLQVMVASVGIYWLYFRLGYSQLWLPLFGTISLGFAYIFVLLFL
ncbi:hypothetical protein HY419_01155, partial [candidate division WWE3 bacterium]|nr:hypothetical protein [candidate division WWE3 bacterium]